MKTKKQKTEKRIYNPPQIERIKLDNEISLVLSSGDAPGDPESSVAQEYFNNNPFKENIG